MTLQYTDYTQGHCWYYVLGGDIPRISLIRQRVIKNGYQGYLDDEIATATRKGHEALRTLRNRIKSRLGNDISAYRAYACALRRYRMVHSTPPMPLTCEDIHVSISLNITIFITILPISCA